MRTVPSPCPSARSQPRPLDRWRHALLVLLWLAASPTWAADLASITLSPESVPGGFSATGSLTLDSGAPAEGLVVDLSSSTPGVVVVPAQVFVTAGETQRTFWVGTTEVSVDTPVTVTASTESAQRSTLLLVTAPMLLESLTVEPSQVQVGDAAQVTVTLQQPAPPGGSVVALSSSHPSAVTLPSSVVVPPGSRTFTFSTAALTANAAVTVTASAQGLAHTATLTVGTVAPLGAIEPSPGCQAVTLPPNDDGSSPPVPLPFPINFFGTTYTFLFVNNNGNVTFNRPMSNYTPFLLDARTPPIIAPFFADVDTRGASSEPVRYSYGETWLGGRRAFCVNWINVGYFAGHTDKLNSFQLLLVDRSDVSAGDFDMVMNYGGIQWETGDASGGTGGSGGVSAGAGFSAGTGNPLAFFQFPGSLVNGAFLDSNPNTGLARTSRNSLVPGRHLFGVRNGSAPTGGTIAGDVTDGTGPLAGAPVQICPAAGGPCAVVTLTSSTGRFTAPGLRPGSYTVTVFPPAGSTRARRTLGPVSILGTEALEQDVELIAPQAPPPGTRLTPSSSGGGGIPVVHYQASLDLETSGCPGGQASYMITSGAGVLASGSLTEGVPSVYSARIPPLFPATGPASVAIRIICPTGVEHLTGFDIYIDPSGIVRTPSGRPVQGAQVTLFRADRPTGPFVRVPDGSPIMSPLNRTNPDLTNAEGYFRWDVIAGYYIVRAERHGCLSASGAPYVESPVMTIPPPVTDLDLRLLCDETLPVSQASLSAPPNAQGWHRAPVTIVLSAEGNVRDIVYSLSGAQTGGAVVAGSRAQVLVSAEGRTRLTWSARDAAGNAETPHTLEIRLDTTAPELSCVATPGVLSPPHHQLVPVQVTVNLQDGLSGSAGFILSALSSNEPEDGRGDGHTEEDMSAWTQGTADVHGLLRSERGGHGSGRVYSLTYEARDQADNTAFCTANVIVPHDSRR